MTTDLALILGTRPEIIKLSPIIHECRREGIRCSVIHTGQHYSNTLDSVFFEQLQLPEPTVNLGIGSGSHGEQTGRMMIRLEQVLSETAPRIVLVQGDTNSVLAGAIVCSKLATKMGHVEAGLRSLDRTMPEETNRVIADHVADYLFPPTDQSKQYLLHEGIPESRITVTGNTIVDALRRNHDIARRETTVLRDLNLQEGEFFLMTAHRQENVDNKARFRGLLEGVHRAATLHGVEVVYPIHPRSRNQLAKHRIDIPERIRLVDPQEYLDFLRLEASAELILTDSGGVQEEACILGVPCVTMRDNTERPETIAVGANQLSSCDPDRIEHCATEMLESDRQWENPFGDGHAAKRILSALPLERELQLVEP